MMIVRNEQYTLASFKRELNKYNLNLQYKLLYLHNLVIIMF